MSHKSKISYLIKSAGRFLLVISLLLTGFGCEPSGVEEKPPPPLPSESFLLKVPLIGDETELRSPPPAPVRFSLVDESVPGWMTPPESVLRFPVNLREGARLSLRMGGKSQVPLRQGDILNRIEFVSTHFPDGIILYENTSSQNLKYFDRWENIDISLEPCGTGEGEIRFIVEGATAGTEGIDIVWGAPAIYYPAERRHRNVLLIGIDTLRLDSVSPYGGNPEITPNLQALSETSTLFTQARSQSSWTLPSFASMVTGQLPSTIGSNIYSGYIPDHAVTIGEMILPEGYATATICSNTWLGNDQSGFHQGMEALWYQYDAPAQAVVDNARSFISRSTGRDWFCFIHLIDPHVPYVPPDHLREKFADPGYTGRFEKDFRAIEEWKSGTEIPTEEDIEQVRALYDAEVANVDEALAALFAFLAQSGQMDETLIIVGADHGEEFYEHGAFEHGHTMYDEQVHMPLIVRGAEFGEGARIDVPVSNLDIVPTILRYYKLPEHENLPGIPLQEMTDGSYEEERVIFGEGNNRGPHRKFAVEWPYKCILDFVSGENRLYNLEDDPMEMNNIADQNAEIVSSLSKSMVVSMLPGETSFHLWIIAKPGDGYRRFTGTLRFEGGIKSVQSFSLEEGDHIKQSGEAVNFAITAVQSNTGIDKHIVIIPEDGVETVEATVMVDGMISRDRFYPYGTLEPEPSGSATVHIDDYPLGSDLSKALVTLPSACFLWGVKGFSRDELQVQLSEEDREQLRALGYIQ